MSTKCRRGAVKTSKIAMNAVETPGDKKSQNLQLQIDIISSGEMHIQFHNF